MSIFSQIFNGADLIFCHFAPAQLLTEQVDAILRDPTELTLTPHPIIYHALLSPEANKGRPLPSRQSLLDEAAIHLGAGADSTGVTLMVTAHYVLQNPQVRQRLEAELREAWPILEETPRYEVLEKLPYLVRPRYPGERNFPHLPLLIEISFWTCSPRSRRKVSACSLELLRTHVSYLAKVP